MPSATRKASSPVPTRRGKPRGAKDAQAAEKPKGYQAGYKAGFAEKEKDLRDALRERYSERNGKDEYGCLFESSAWVDPGLVAIREGYTPEQQQQYNNGYERGYREGYDSSYRLADRQGYDETYLPSYNSAYQFIYQNAYREGFGNGKDKGFQVAYQYTYDIAYSESYHLNRSLEYSYERSRGNQEGLVQGKQKGFAAASKKLYDQGYKEAYEQTAAIVYPQAFGEGKSAGITAADRHYRDNAVLELRNIAIHDETGDLIFRTGENFGVSFEMVNYGFKAAEGLTLETSSTCGFVTLQGQIHAGGVPGREKARVDLIIGRVNDDAPMGVTAPIKLEVRNLGTSLAAQVVKIELFNESQKLGLINADSVNVRKGPGTNFPILATLSKGNKVAVIILEKDWYKVVLSDGRTGFIYKNLLSVP